MTPCNCYALRRATRRATQLYDQMLAPCGLRATQFSLLMEIANRAPIALGLLAQHMVMDPATMGKNVRPLQTAGYVAIVPGRDRRSREVALTDAGRGIIAAALPLWQQAQDRFDAGMGAARAADLRGVLGTVADTDFLAG